MTTSSSKLEGQTLEDDELRLQAKREIDKMGVYQVTMYLVISLPVILSAANSIGYVFTTAEIDYRCRISECENATENDWIPEWIDHAIPKKDGKIETCKRYGAMKSVNDTSTCSALSFTTEEQSCDSWVYNSNETTIFNEWDLTCDENRWKLAMVGTVNNIGQFVGLIFAGYLSDRFGRRAVLTMLTTVSGVMGVIQSFSVNYWMFNAFEFLQALATSGMYSAGYILGVEMVGEKRRVLGGTISACCYAVGEVILGLSAMWLRSWRGQLRLFYISGLFAVFLPAIIPESTRWLVVNGRTADLEKSHKKMARMNGFELTRHKLNMYTELSYGNVRAETRKSVPRDRVLTVKALQSSILVVRLLACCVCWLTNTFVYYGLSLNAVAIAGDKYVNFILVSLIEIPALFLSYFLINRLGRKATLAGSFLGSGVFCLIYQFVPSVSSDILPLILFLGGKACIAVAFSANYVFTSELFPTGARHSLLAMCSMTGRIGSILAPQTRLLSSVMESLPLILFGCMGITAGLISLIFPETLGSKLPDTIEEAENIRTILPEKFATSARP